MSKRTHDEVRYRRGIGSKRCCHCSMYRESDDEAGEYNGDDESKEPPPHCTDVADPIDPKGMCDIFDRRER